MWVRGLKLGSVEDKLNNVLSHPMWVRGLKPSWCAADCRTCVAPYVGAWIETTAIKPKLLDFQVAPYVGAWIETLTILLS